MRLTRADLERAAAQAEKYPAGHGHDWGWGGLARADSDAIGALLRDRRGLLEQG